MFEDRIAALEAEFNSVEADLADPEVLTDSDIGFGIFIRDPDGQLIELLPMSYREQLDT